VAARSVGDLRSCAGTDGGCTYIRMQRGLEVSEQLARAPVGMRLARRDEELGDPVRQLVGNVAQERSEA